ANAISIVAPCIVPLCLRLTKFRGVVANTCLEGKDFDVNRDPKRQSLIAFPTVVRPTSDSRVFVTFMLRKRCTRCDHLVHCSLLPANALYPSPARAECL